MSICENTTQITYGDVTRPLTTVWARNYSESRHLQKTARVLHLFKDLIGEDYQKYLHTELDFDINKDSEATLTLPDLVLHFNIHTLGHGEIKVSLSNDYCETIRDGNQHIPFNIKFKISEELGISPECIELCNEDGEDCSDVLVGYKPHMNIYATFIDHKETVILDGHEILNEYDGQLKEGNLMIIEWTKCIGDYVIVRFHKNKTGEPSSGEIIKRTPKMCKFILYDGYDRGVENKKFILRKTGEVLHGPGRQYVNYMENIDFNKTYAFPAFR